jgi:hypothetical protein
VVAGAEESNDAVNLPVTTAARRGQATLDVRLFYLVHGDRHNDVWQLGGRHRLTSRPGVGLSATDRWATQNSFLKLNFNDKIELSTGKVAKG